MQSSIGGVIKVEDNLRKAQDNQSQMSSASRRFDYRDRVGNDIFNFSNAPDDSGAAGKKKVTNHQATQNNGNLTYWDKWTQRFPLGIEIYCKFKTDTFINLSYFKNFLINIMR